MTNSVTFLCQVRHKTLTQSINQSTIKKYPRSKIEVRPTALLRYSTPIRALTLSCGLEFQAQASYGHDARSVMHTHTHTHTQNPSSDVSRFKR